MVLIVKESASHTMRDITLCWSAGLVLSLCVNANNTGRPVLSLTIRQSLASNANPGGTRDAQQWESQQCLTVPMPVLRAHCVVEWCQQSNSPSPYIVRQLFR